MTKNLSHSVFVFSFVFFSLLPFSFGETHTAAGHTFSVTPIAEGLKNPWSLVELESGEILVTERSGAIRRIVDRKLLAEPVTGVPEVYAKGQGGLLDLALHPDFADNKFLYFAYSMPKGDTAMTAVMRARYENGKLSDQKIIFEAPESEFTRSGPHYGCRLVFDKNNHLLFSIGDRGVMNNAQNLSNHKGKILRVTDEGEIPSDNPFLDDSDVPPALYAYGVRNPQGMDIHPVTHEIWETEHGPRGGDELNIIKAGKNYGWPKVTYGINYNGTPISEVTELPGIEPPVHYWVPSPALAGIAFYQGNQFPKWQNHLLITALKFESLSLVEIENNQFVRETILLKNIGRVRDVVVARDGSIFVVLDNPGTILHIQAI